MAKKQASGAAAVFTAEELATDPCATAPTLLHVRALQDGFRRAGRAWPAAGVVVAVADFTPLQLAQIVADPGLVVTPAEAPDAE